jgi:hypothetical protein
MMMKEYRSKMPRLLASYSSAATYIRREGDGLIALSLEELKKFYAKCNHAIVIGCIQIQGSAIDVSTTMCRCEIKLTLSAHVDIGPFLSLEFS